jgi:hypothetical protein
MPMAGSTNVLQWNPNLTGPQETDAQYLADAQRAGGATNPSIFNPTTANKLFYQLSTYVAGLAQMLAGKGYSNSDANLPALVAVMNNILTRTDLPLGLVSLSSATTTTINLASGAVFNINLAGNVSSLAVTGTFHVPVTLGFRQSSGGGLTVTFGSQFVGAGTVNPAANSMSVQQFALMADGLYHPVTPMTWS